MASMAGFHLDVSLVAKKWTEGPNGGSKSMVKTVPVALFGTVVIVARLRLLMKVAECSFRLW